MAIIDQEGLFKGKRLRKCSPMARWRWPYLFLLSNGYARIELDYECIADEFSSFRRSAPTPDELRETFAEFRENHLLYVYKFNDQEWGQWDCLRSRLKDYKTTADNASPKPPENDYQQWLREQHGDEWREFHWSKDPGQEAFAQNSPKASVNLAQSFEAECHGVGGGVGEGKSISPNLDLEKDAVREVFAYYLEKTDRNPSLYTLTPKRMGKGLSRFRECLTKAADGTPASAIAMMKLAIDSLVRSDWHMGRDPKTSGKKYCEWDKHLFDSYEQMERWWNRG